MSDPQAPRELTSKEIEAHDAHHAKHFARLIKLQKPQTELAELQSRMAAAQLIALQNRVQLYQVRTKLVELAAEEGLAAQVKQAMTLAEEKRQAQTDLAAFEATQFQQTSTPDGAGFERLHEHGCVMDLDHDGLCQTTNQTPPTRPEPTA